MCPACTGLVVLEKPFEMDTLLTPIRHLLEENSRKPFFFNLQGFGERGPVRSAFLGAVWTDAQD
jgi:hypothetical protein